MDSKDKFVIGLLIIGLAILSFGLLHTINAAIISFYKPPTDLISDFDRTQKIHPFSKVFQIGDYHNPTKIQYQMVIQTEDVFAVNNRLDIKAQVKTIGPKIEEKIYLFLDSYNINYTAINEGNFETTLNAARNNDGVLEFHPIGFTDDGWRLYQAEGNIKYPVEHEVSFLPVVISTNDGFNPLPAIENIITIYPAYTKLQAESSIATLVSTQIQDRTNQVNLGLTLVIISGIPLVIVIEYFLKSQKNDLKIKKNLESSTPKTVKTKAIIILSIGIGSITYWSLVSRDSFSLFYNMLGIFFEFIGFLFILISSKKLKLKIGPFQSDIYIDPTTGKPPEEIEGPPDPRFWVWGTVLVVIGLAFQLFGTMFQELLPKE